MAATAVPRPGREDEAAGPAWLDRSLFPFESRFTEIDGRRVHYVDEGQGPLLLFLHGTPQWSFQWRGLIRRLRGRFRCVALDYPGLGLSRPRSGYGFTVASTRRWSTA